ncbi:MAG: hypothetical protein KC503_06225 [Myxococcales bacterium]|nr:hypothetical protein [Myxococcales bacterium]
MRRGAWLLVVAAASLVLGGCPKKAKHNTTGGAAAAGSASKALGDKAPQVIKAQDDKQLRAEILSCKPLRYAAAPPADADIPPFVRAASAICRTPRGLCVVQDDVNAVALLDGGEVATPILLPKGHGGRRTFDRGIGNKKHRLDLESCIALPLGGMPHLVALGSGSKKRRRRIALVPIGDPRRGPGGGPPRLFDANAFYQRLVKLRRFSGARLNIEGAVVLGDDVLRLYQRGNSKARKGRAPSNASVDISLAAFTRWLGNTGTLPEPGRVRRFELGALGKARWGFTDAASLDGRHVLVLAAAEATDDPNADGAVLGARIGVDDGRSLRWTPLREAGGKPSRRKVEGVTFDPRDSSRLIVTTDADDHKSPAQICHVALSGPWR